MRLISQSSPIWRDADWKGCAILNKFKKWKKKSKHKTEVRTVLLELGIVLGILKKVT